MNSFPRRILAAPKRVSKIRRTEDSVGVQAHHCRLAQVDNLRRAGGGTCNTVRECHTARSREPVEKENENQKAHDITNVRIQAAMMHSSQEPSHGAHRCADRA